MKGVKIIMLLMLLSAGVLSLTGCATSAQGRQEARQTGRVEHRQEERRGWD
jgi:hypothetical protein